MIRQRDYSTLYIHTYIRTYVHTYIHTYICLLIHQSRAHRRHIQYEHDLLHAPNRGLYPDVYQWINSASVLHSVDEISQCLISSNINALGFLIRVQCKISNTYRIKKPDDVYTWGNFLCKRTFFPVCGMSEYVNYPCVFLPCTSYIYIIVCLFLQKKYTISVVEFLHQCVLSKRKEFTVYPRELYPRMKYLTIQTQHKIQSR